MWYEMKNEDELMLVVIITRWEFRFSCHFWHVVLMKIEKNAQDVN